MLYIVSTPIGNLEDISLRALRVLKEVDIILAEDTRKTSILLKHFSIKKTLVSFYEHNEAKRLPWVIRELKNGKNIALVSNAGTPTISDPGYKLIRECKKNQISLTAIPGACSLINALVLSSFPHEEFIFFGYLSRRPNIRKKIWEFLKKMNITAVFFESPYRVLDILKEIKENFGNRNIGVFREMTKKFEEVLEGNPQDIITYFEKNKPRGEFTLILNREEPT